MKDYIELSRTQLLNAIIKGWKILGYTRGKYFGDKAGRAIDFNTQSDAQRIKCACALGAAAYVLKVDPDEIITAMPAIDIVNASDMARSKERALKRIRKEMLEDWPAGVKMRIYKGAARI